MHTPFRWNLTKHEQLGRLVTGEPALPSVHFLPELRACAARVVAFTSDSDLVFVGRSPENLFDYLSGIFASTSWSERCSLLTLSLRLNAQENLRQIYPDALAPAYTLLEEHQLLPEMLLQRPRPITFIDLVASGETFGHLVRLLIERAQEKQLDIRALKKKLGFVGITRRTKTSPNTWRWRQQVSWTAHVSPQAIKNVSIPGWLWDYWGNEQDKVTAAYPPWRWGTDTVRQPPRDPRHLSALTLAVYLYDRGNSAAERRTFASRLIRAPAMSERWYRSLILELRQAA